MNKNRDEVKGFDSLMFAEPEVNMGDYLKTYIFFKTIINFFICHLDKMACSHFGEKMLR